MKLFSERNPVAVAGVGVAATLALLVAALNYDRLPGFDDGSEYAAYFAEAGGLRAGAPVQQSGYAVGTVRSIHLDGNRVLVRFDVDKAVRLGDRTEAAIKTKSLLGAKFLEVTPRGDDNLTAPIPVERTRPAYQLPDAIGELTTAISGLDTDRLSESLSVLSNAFEDTPAELRAAMQGVARISETLHKRDEHLRLLLENANKSTTVLAERSDRIVTLITNTNALLVELQGQSAALDEISNNIAAAAEQVTGLIADHRGTFKPAVDKLNGVLAIVDHRKERVQQSIVLLNKYAMSLGESVSSGPFFKAYVANLLPGQFLQPFIDAAFSDLGLDPNVLAPSELVDPQVGQSGTPHLPVPYPRTGQGGAPKLALPDAITGKPGDPRYPYREPLPAPPPGGPPPGPPAPAIEEAGR